MKTYYDSFSIRFDNGETATDTLYSDRLIQWDYKKYSELSQKHFRNQSQYWTDRRAESIQSFLREYTDNPTLILCRVEELENKSNGYPYWRFDYKTE